MFRVAICLVAMLLAVNPHISAGQMCEESVCHSNSAEIRDLGRDISKLKDQLNAMPRSTRCYMGMKFGDIPDHEITASSSWDHLHLTERARLDSQKLADGRRGAWVAGSRSQNSRQWIQVDLGKLKPVAGIITQGRADTNQWVTSYEAMCGDSRGNFRSIRGLSNREVLRANTDRHTKVFNKFNSADYNCRYVRIKPKTWYTYIALRFELIHGSCYNDY